jgi:hypothetical protein
VLPGVEDKEMAVTTDTHLETTMYTSRDIEFEQGTCSGRRRRHDGYYAGDFTDRPLPSQETLRQLAVMARPQDPVGKAVGRGVVGGW